MTPPLHSAGAGRRDEVAKLVGFPDFMIQQLDKPDDYANFITIVEHKVGPAVIGIISDAVRAGEAFLWSVGTRYFYDDPGFSVREVIEVTDLAYSTEKGMYVDRFQPLTDDGPMLELPDQNVRIAYMHYPVRDRGWAEAGAYTIYMPDAFVWRSAYTVDVLTDRQIEVWKAGERAHEPIFGEEEGQVYRWVREYTRMVQARG